MLMPEPDAEVIGRRQKIADDLRAIVPGEGVIVDQDELLSIEDPVLLQAAIAKTKKRTAQ